MGNEGEGRGLGMRVPVCRYSLDSYGSGGPDYYRARGFDCEPVFGKCRFHAPSDQAVSYST